MNTEQQTCTAANGWSSSQSALGETTQLVLVSGARSLLQQASHRAEIRAAYPNALTVGCSTAGEISPLSPGKRCELHNETMTITLLAETEP